MSMCVPFEHLALPIQQTLAPGGAGVLAASAKSRVRQAGLPIFLLAAMRGGRGGAILRPDPCLSAC